MPRCHPQSFAWRTLLQKEKGGERIGSGPQVGQVATQPLPLGGPRRFRAGDRIKSGPRVGHPFLRDPTKGNKNTSGCLTPTFSEAQKRAELRHNPCILGDTGKRGTKSEKAASPPPSRGPKRGRNCGITPAFSGIPTKGNKIRSGYLTPAFSGAQKRAELRHNPCILGDTGKRGTKSEVAASPPPSRRPKRGWNCDITPAFSGIPNKGERNQKWLPHPYLLGGPKEGGIAT